MTYGKRGPSPQRVTYRQLTNPVIDSSAVNARWGTNVDLSFTVRQEGGVILTPYVPWAPGMGGRSGVTLGAGLDLGQQSQASWTEISGGEQGLYNEFASALGRRVQRQDAISWRASHPNAELTVPQAELVTQNSLGVYVGRAQRSFDSMAGPGAFARLPGNQQTVYFDRMYNSSSQVNPTFNSYAKKGDWAGAGKYLRSQANAHPRSPLGARLGAEAKLLGY